MRKVRGFTMVEIIIAVAIIGILMAIAVPSYLEHLRKGRRADAEGFLADVANRQQQYILDARTYAVGGTALDELKATPSQTVKDFYDVTVTPSAPTNPPTFVITATPISSKSQVADGILSINEQGQKKRMVGGVDKGW